MKLRARRGHDRRHLALVAPSAARLESLLGSGLTKQLVEVPLGGRSWLQLRHSKRTPSGFLISIRNAFVSRQESEGMRPSDAELNDFTTGRNLRSEACRKTVNRWLWLDLRVNRFGVALALDGRISFPESSMFSVSLETGLTIAGELVQAPVARARTVMSSKACWLRRHIERLTKNHLNNRVSGQGQAMCHPIPIVIVLAPISRCGPTAGQLRNEEEESVSAFIEQIESSAFQPRSLQVNVARAPGDASAIFIRERGGQNMRMRAPESLMSGFAVVGGLHELKYQPSPQGQADPAHSASQRLEGGLAKLETLEGLEKHDQCRA